MSLESSRQDAGIQTPWTAAPSVEYVLVNWILQAEPKTNSTP